mmetsp:Transcript_92005/g.263572  ORF Transcript_92005/g.263572 Transcript_92005/m.263572 type:complete len:241 (+) Transcript_92005:1261-1983(+)
MSSAELFVKVSKRMCLGLAPLRTKWPTRPSRVVVFPVPAPATMTNDASIAPVAAASCISFRLRPGPSLWGPSSAKVCALGPCCAGSGFRLLRRMHIAQSNGSGSGACGPTSRPLKARLLPLAPTVRVDAAGAGPGGAAATTIAPCTDTCIDVLPIAGTLPMGAIATSAPAEAAPDRARPFGAEGLLAGTTLTSDVDDAVADVAVAWCVGAGMPTPCVVAVDGSAVGGEKGPCPAPGTMPI